MIAFEPPRPSPPVIQRLAGEIARVSDRLRTLSLDRLSGPLPPYASRAEAGRALAQRLADAAQGIEGRGSGEPPSWREVPRLGDHAAGDQVAVTGQDLLAALAAAEADDEVSAKAWTRAGRRPVREVAEDAAAALRELRLAL
jgi:hypothetical protein